MRVEAGNLRMLELFQPVGIVSWQNRVLFFPDTSQRSSANLERIWHSKLSLIWATKPFIKKKRDALQMDRKNKKKIMPFWTSHLYELIFFQLKYLRF